MPTGRYAQVIEKLRPGRRRTRRDRACRWPRARPAQGHLHFTVGQRKGLGIAAGDPLYVVRVDAEAPRSHRRPARASLDVQHIDAARRQLAGRSRHRPACRRRRRSVRARAFEPGAAGRDAARSTAARSKFCCTRPEPGIAAGQACVFYTAGDADARVLGGGFIVAHHAPCRRRTRYLDGPRPLGRRPFHPSRFHRIRRPVINRSRTLVVRGSRQAWHRHCVHQSTIRARTSSMAPPSAAPDGRGRGQRRVPPLGAGL